jgi:hypothetical protein
MGLVVGRKLGGSLAAVPAGAAAALRAEPGAAAGVSVRLTFVLSQPKVCPVGTATYTRAGLPLAGVAEAGAAA